MIGQFGEGLSGGEGWEGATGCDARVSARYGPTGYFCPGRSHINEREATEPR